MTTHKLLLRAAFFVLILLAHGPAQAQEFNARAQTPKVFSSNAYPTQPRVAKYQRVRPVPHTYKVRRTPEVKFYEPRVPKAHETRFYEPGVPRTPETRFEQPRVRQTPDIRFQEPRVPKTPDVRFRDPRVPRSPEVRFKNPRVKKTPEVRFIRPRVKKSPPSSSYDTAVRRRGGTPDYVTYDPEYVANR